MQRKTLLYLVLALVLLGAAHGFYWHWSAESLQSGIAEWRDEQRARGYEIDYQGPEVGGYPLRLVARIDQPRIQAPKGWRWSGPSVVASSALWAPLTVHLDFPGQHQVARSEKDRTIEIELREAAADIVLRGDGGLDQATSRLSQGMVSNTGQGTFTFEALDLTLGPLMKGRGSEPQELDVAGTVTSLLLPELEDNALGREVERVALAGTLVGEIEEGEPRKLLSDWRDGGGVVDIASLEIIWGPLALTGDGTLALDHELRPLGAFSNRIAGLNETIEALFAHGLIEREAVWGAKLALAAFASGQDAKGRPIVEVPITLQNGYLNLGIVPLVPIPPVL